jgi:cell division protein FtsL
MMRVNLVLMIAVLASAVYLVHIQYESRRVFTELDRTRAESRRIASEYERLQVEKRAQATPARVEKIAREKLQMRPALPSITTYVTYAEASQVSPSAMVPAPQDVSKAAP